MKETKGAIMADVDGNVERSHIVAPNTVEYWRPDGARVIRLHPTDILTFERGGAVVLNSGGWRTVTTKDRINRFLPPPWTLYREDGVWYVTDRRPFYREPDADIRRYVYADGMRIGARGGVTGAAPATAPAKLKKLARRINGYARDYAAAFVKGDVPAPSGADCWYCGLIICGNKDKGKSLGEVTRDSHLQSHMAERYYVPSLLNRAHKAFPGLLSVMAQSYIAGRWGLNGGTEEHCKYGGEIAASQIRGIIRRYMRKELGLSS